MIFRRIAQIYIAVLLAFFVIFYGKSIQSYSLLQTDQILQNPNAQFWFGTDSLGRDLFSRIVIGGIVTLAISMMASFGSLVFAVLVGVVLGWSEKSVDNWGLKLLNVYHAIPSFVIASILCLGFQNAFSNLPLNLGSILSLVLSLVFTHWMSSARLIRTELKRMKIENYITATQSLGASQLQTLKFHLAPYLKSKIKLMFGFIFPTVLFYESVLSFVGFGIQAPLTSWGLLIQEGWRNIGSYPHLIFIPMLFVIMTVWSISVLVSRES